MLCDTIVMSRCSLRAIAAGIICASAGTPALAQEAQPASAHAASDPSDIVVTARRRSESAQKVPIALTALSAESLQERHITTGQDLQGQVPSLSVGSFGQGRSVESFSIRGQGTSFGASPAVVQYLAEVPQVAGTAASLQSLPGLFLDVGSIQVLRGPQGTLFGRNTTGGAILLEPIKPTDKFGGYWQVQGGNYGDKEIEAVFNVPIIEDKLLVRVAGRYVDRDGFSRDIITGVDYDDRHYYTGRIGITWRPFDGVENYLMAYGTRSKDHGTGNVVGQFNLPYLDAVFGGCANVGLGQNCAALTELSDAQAGRSVRNVALGPGNLGSRIDGWGVVDQLKVDLSEQIMLRNIASYSRLTASTAFDGDGTPLPIYNFGNVDLGGNADDVRQYTNEFQIQGSLAADRIQYTTGIYYENIATAGLNRSTGAAFFELSSTDISYRKTSTGLYAQATVDFGFLADGMSGLRLTGGFRYTWDKVRGGGAPYTVTDDGSPISCSNGLPVTPSVPSDCLLSGELKTSAPSWTIGLDYDVTDTVLAYAKVSRGYKAGGVNYGAVNAIYRIYQPEFVTTYEGGLKTRFMIGDMRFVLNGNVFLSDYKDAQKGAGDFNPDTGSAGTAVFNAASGRIKGLEIETSIRPFNGLELSGNYSHVIAKYSNFLLNVPLGQFDCSGNFVVGTADLSCIPFQNTPKDQFSVSGRYEFPIGPTAGQINLTATYSYTAKQYVSGVTLPEYEPGSYLRSYGLLNLSVNWDSIFQSNVDIGLFMTNATNETYRIGNTNVFSALGVQSSVYGEPRMYGMQLRYHW